MTKVITILGARPQFVKAGVVSRAIRTQDGISEKIVHTGQHFDENMSGVFFKEFGMAEPDYFLNINSGTHGKMTGLMLAGVEEILMQEKPDVVMVYGDTNSTLAGALAAVKLHIPIAHVEAGLRSFNMVMPEEVNRILTDRISSMLFSSTDVATRNLLAEGVSPEKIFEYGDVMYDAALHGSAGLRADEGVMVELGLEPEKFAVATIHRAENTDDVERLRIVFEALIKFAKKTQIVLPMHPRTSSKLKEFGLFDIVCDALTVIDPINYSEMLRLLRYGALAITDSGGLQKEAFFMKTPCVTVRDETEWVELVEGRWNKIAPPTSVRSILESVEEMLGTRGLDIEPYGKGDAAVKIAAHLAAS